MSFKDIIIVYYRPQSTKMQAQATPNPYIPEPELALSLGETKSMLQVDEDRFRRFARRANLPDRLIADVARETAQRLREAWATHPATDLLSTPVRDAVSAHMARVPLGR